MKRAGYPDDWGEGYVECDKCGQTYHKSGTEGCGCKMIRAVITIPIELYSDADLTSVLEAVQMTTLEDDLESNYEITSNIDSDGITVEYVKCE